jgi:hypothetical protein
VNPGFLRNPRIAYFKSCQTVSKSIF